MRKDLVLVFGDRDDGVLGIPAITDDGQVIETSYFFGKKHPKNIINISSQAGCPLKCSFCEIGSERFVRNLTAREIGDQVRLMLEEAARHGFDALRIPHKVTVANSGEPLINPNLVDGLRLVPPAIASFKVSTVFPAAKRATENFALLADFAAEQGLRSRPLQLQISLISTSEEHRRKASGGKVAGFRAIRDAAELWRSANPSGRAINLSLILADDTPCDVDDVSAIFPPALFRFRFREYVPTRNGGGNGLSVIPSSRLMAVKQAFADSGYEVGDWASPTPTEWRFGLAGNVIRRMYLDMVKTP